MISLALIPAILLAAAPGNSMASSRQAYSACLKAQSSEAVAKKAAVDDFTKAVAASCSQQEAAFKAAVVAEQLSMKASRKDAEQAAADWAADFRNNATETYKMTVSDEKSPN